MKKNILIQSILSLTTLLAIIFVFPVAIASACSATDLTTDNVCLDSLPQVNTGTGSDLVAVIMNIVFGVIGLISVIVVSLAGFSYITSGGDPQKTAKAKDTILYALVGVVVAILGATITSFVAGYFR